MKKNWEIVRLGDLCESDLGKTLNKSHDTGNFHPYLCSINVLWDKIDLSTLKEARFNENEIEKYSVQKGDLLICEGGDIGRCAIWEKEESFLYQNAIHRVRFNDRINPRYCLYYLKHLKDTGTLDSRYGKGVTIKHLVKSSLHSIPIPVPPLPVQARIVDELDCLQGILSKKRQQLAEYHSLAQAIFHQMFGDPVVNEKGWEVKRLGEVFDITSSKRIYQNELLLEGIPFYKVSDIVSLIDKNEVVPNSFISEYTYKDLVKNGNVPQANDLLITSRGTLGKCYIVKMNDKFYFQDGMVTWLRQKEEPILPTYVSYVFLENSFKSYLYKNAKHTTVDYISIQHLSKMLIPLPPLPLQQSFAARIAAIDSQRERLAASIRELETLLACRMETLLNCPQA